MNDTVLLNGKKYLSSRRAAEITGYAQDYIGQLARSKRVDARRVGRAWYVEENSLLGYEEGSRGDYEEDTDTPTAAAGASETAVETEEPKPAPASGNDSAEDSEKENSESRQPEKSDTSEEAETETGEDEISDSRDASESQDASREAETGTEEENEDADADADADMDENLLETKASEIGSGASIGDTRSDTPSEKPAKRKFAFTEPAPDMPEEEETENVLDAGGGMFTYVSDTRPVHPTITGSGQTDRAEASREDAHSEISPNAESRRQHQGIRARHTYDEGRAQLDDTPQATEADIEEAAAQSGVAGEEVDKSAQKGGRAKGVFVGVVVCGIAAALFVISVAMVKTVLYSGGNGGTITTTYQIDISEFMRVLKGE